jgi:bifunctional DNA-binding transcriptional regulator/antitoxin component of YhaV-PrlF toxin-antitoxin module
MEIAGVASAWKVTDGTLVVVIPAEARRRMGLKPKDKFLVKYDVEKMVLTYEFLR